MPRLQDGASLRRIRDPLDLGQEGNTVKEITKRNLAVAFGTGVALIIVYVMFLLVRCAASVQWRPCG